MTELSTQNAESNQQRGEGLDNHRQTGKCSLKYYIHDSVSALKLQLIGDLREANVAGLNGTWQTAKITLRQRKLLLDLSQLHSSDEEGQRWLGQMRAEGAILLPENYFESTIPENRIQEAVPPASTRLSLIGRILGMFRGDKVLLRPEP